MGSWGEPWRLEHPDVDDTVDVQSLGAAFHAAAFGNSIGLAAASHRGKVLLPRLELGDLVDLNELARAVGFVSDNIEHAAERAVELNPPDAFVAASRYHEPGEVVAGLTTFMIGVRRWLAEALEAGGQATVAVGPATITDPTVPRLRF